MKISLALISQLLRLVVLCSVLTATPVFAAGGGLSSSLSAFLGEDTQDEVLPPEAAFKLDLQAQSPWALQADFIIAPGHYLYKERLGFEVQSPGGSIDTIDLPVGEPKNDPTFGMTEVYYNYTTAQLDLSEDSRFPVKLKITYQGCNARGLCYAPMHKTFMLDASGALSETNDSGAVVASESDEITALFQDGRLWLLVAGFFGFGLLLSLTPCVLPMIPILSSIIVGGKQFNRWHTFSLSLAYTLGMALTYTLIGVAAGLSGQLLSTVLQNAWALSFGALVFVALALSMFGFYELQLPNGLQSRINNLSGRFKGGHLLGVFLMGVLSALILSPCVAAPLAAALLYIGQTHDVWFGGIALFALSMGMGVPLLLLGASAGSLLPKVGAWMVAIRYFFGVIMLAMALWLVAPLLPSSVELLLWAVLLIVSAVYLRAFDTLPADAHGWLRLWKGVGVVLFALGLLLLIGAASGAKSPLQPLSNLRGGGDVSALQTTGLSFQRVTTVADLENRINAASGQMVMLDFYADWCVSCKEMEAFTFSDLRVQSALRDAVLLQADVTANSAADAALLKRFGLFGPPGILFFDANGQELRQHRVIGFQNADKFLATLSRAGQ